MAVRECTICIEPFNKATRKECVCPSCNYSVCRTCLQKFILTLDTSIVPCMNCKKIWNHDTLDLMITKQFRNTVFKQRREQILLEHEKSLLPATQPEVQRIKSIRHHKEVQASLIEKRAAMLKEMDAEITKVSRAIYHLHTGEGETFLKEKRTFTIHCPVSSCRGFVQSSDWMCGTCSHFACSKCHEQIGLSKDLEHTCNEESIETAKLIRKETRSCPGCSTLIYKISGCNQMWCTQCHTTFGWKTGEVISGNVHNPHYYEWVQRNGPVATTRNLGDVPCGGLLDIYRLQNFLSNFPKEFQNTQTERPIRRKIGRHYNSVEEESVYTIHRICNHIERDELPIYRVNNNTNNLYLRAQYLMQEIQESEFKVLLQQREKKNEKRKEIYSVLEMYLFTMVDMFNNLIADCEQRNSYTLQDLITWTEQVYKLQEFANNQLEKISQRYICVVPIIRKTELITLRY